MLETPTIFQYTTIELEHMLVNCGNSLNLYYQLTHFVMNNSLQNKYNKKHSLIRLFERPTSFLGLFSFREVELYTLLKLPTNYNIDLCHFLIISSSLSFFILSSLSYMTLFSKWSSLFCAHIPFALLCPQFLQLVVT